jgi:DDE family transposase
MHSRVARVTAGQYLLKNYLPMAMHVMMIRAKFLALKPVMDERLTRLWAGAEAEAIGSGGITLVAAATGMSRTTIRAGRDELRRGVAAHDVVKVRRAGAGRPSIERRTPEVVDALDHLMEPAARGELEAPLRWTSKSTRKLSTELDRQGFSISPQKVAQLLHAGGYRLQGVDRSIEGASHALRGQQLELINERVKAFHARGAPVIAVETRHQLAPAIDPDGIAERGARVPAAAPGARALDKLTAPEGCDAARDAGWVNAELDPDTPAFAVRAISDWWEHMGRRSCGGATELLVITEAGGDFAHARRWRTELQLFADRTRLTTGVSHFPAGTSKWTQIEHCMICRVTERWCGRPASSGIAASGNRDGQTGGGDPDGPARATRGIHRETVVQLIGGARPMAGSGAPPAPDAHRLPAEWNYTLHPRRDRW